MAFYAVRQGRNIGVYNTWEQCEKQVKGFSGAEFKRFTIYEDAVSFVKGDESNE